MVVDIGGVKTGAVPPTIAAVKSSSAFWVLPASYSAVPGVMAEEEARLADSICAASVSIPEPAPVRLLDIIPLPNPGRSVVSIAPVTLPNAVAFCATSLLNASYCASEIGVPSAFVKAQAAR